MSSTSDQLDSFEARTRPAGSGGRVPRSELQHKKKKKPAAKKARPSVAQKAPKRALLPRQALAAKEQAKKKKKRKAAGKKRKAADKKRKVAGKKRKVAHKKRKVAHKKRKEYSYARMHHQERDAKGKVKRCPPKHRFNKKAGVCRHKSIGSRAKVMHGTALRTVGGLHVKDIMRVKRAGAVRYISRARHDAAMLKKGRDGLTASQRVRTAKFVARRFKPGHKPWNKGLRGAAHRQRKFEREEDRKRERRQAYHEKKAAAAPKRKRLSRVPKV